MKNLYETIKKEVPIKQYLNDQLAIEFIRLGEDKHRVNPCPFCNHLDCFTIFNLNQSFHCFSCEESGDVFHLEKHFQGLQSNYEAAKSIAMKYEFDF